VSRRIDVRIPIRVESGITPRLDFLVKQAPGPKSTRVLEPTKHDYVQKREVLRGLTRNQQAKALGTTRSTLYRVLRELGEL
jgi:hypothetical protein